MGAECARFAPVLWALTLGCDVKVQNKALQSEIKNHQSTIHMGLRAQHPASYPAFNQKSEIINQQFTSSRVPQVRTRPLGVNLGMRCESTEQGPSIRNQKSSINNSHRVSGLVHLSAGSRVDRVRPPTRPNPRPPAFIPLAGSTAPFLI